MVWRPILCKSTRIRCQGSRLCVKIHEMAAWGPLCVWKHSTLPHLGCAQDANSLAMHKNTRICCLGAILCVKLHGFVPGARFYMSHLKDAKGLRFGVILFYRLRLIIGAQLNGLCRTPLRLNPHRGTCSEWRSTVRLGHGPQSLTIVSCAPSSSLGLGFRV